MKCKGFNIAITQSCVTWGASQAAAACQLGSMLRLFHGGGNRMKKYKPDNEVNELFDFFLLQAACKLCDRAGGEMKLTWVSDLRSLKLTVTAQMWTEQRQARASGASMGQHLETSFPSLRSSGWDLPCPCRPLIRIHLLSQTCIAL